MNSFLLQIYAKFGENGSRNTTVRVRRQTDAQTQTGSHAIAYGADNKITISALASRRTVVGYILYMFLAFQVLVSFQRRRRRPTTE